eukprot:s1775_g9.t1
MPPVFYKRGWVADTPSEVLQNALDRAGNSAPGESSGGGPPAEEVDDDLPGWRCIGSRWVLGLPAPDASGIQLDASVGIEVFGPRVSELGTHMGTCMSGCFPESGDALASIPLEEVQDVRQRLLLHGERLADAVKLESSMELDLVLLTFGESSQEQAGDLVTAARHGSLAEVESMLQLPQDPNLFDSNGCRPIGLASYYGHVETVRLLLQAGAKSDLAFRGGVHDGKTVLNCASCNGVVEVVRLLLESGTDKYMPDNCGNSALMKASCNCHVEVVRLLLEAGANTDLAGEEGSTALMFASYERHVQVVRLLLEAGANKRFAVQEWCSHLTKEGHVEVVRLLLEAGADKDLANTCRNTALRKASDKGHVEVVRLLLEAGANTDLAGEDGSTALKYASYKGHAEVVRLPLEGGADLHVAINTGKSAWMLALENAMSAVSCWIPPWMCQTTTCCFRQILKSYASFRTTTITTQALRLVLEGASLDLPWPRPVTQNEVDSLEAKFSKKTCELPEPWVYRQGRKPRGWTSTIFAGGHRINTGCGLLGRGYG